MARKQRKAQDEKKTFGSWNSMEQVERKNLIGKSLKGKEKKDGKIEGNETTAICYTSYQFTLKEWISYTTVYFVVVIMIGYLFYDSVWFSIVMVPFLFPYFKIVQKREAEKRLEKLKTEFKDALHALTASLHTGYAIENAFLEAYTELSLLYGKDVLIVQEFDYMLKQMKVSRTVEEVLEEFAIRSGLEDIQNFSQVFSIANRSGGKLISIMDAAAETIGQKIEVEREILTMIQGKKLEQRIMSMVPIGMILYLRIGNGGFMKVLYESFTGRAVMTGCLIGYLFAIWMGEKIMGIKV